MNRTEFISLIAPLVQHYAPLYGIKVCSPIIAQGILESDGGNSELAVNCFNFHGLKWRVGRCPTAIGSYSKVGSEQNSDGSYTSSNMLWMKFGNVEDGIIGYFDFIKNYSGIKGVTDPRAYLEALKKNSYATSLKYVDNVMDVIDTYNLTRFDPEEVHNLKIVIDAGHGRNTAGKRCMKKLDSNETREWILNSRIADTLQKLLASYDCNVLRVDDVTGATDVSLTDRVKKANDWGADVYISIHHNAGIYGGSGGGTVVFYYSSKAERKAQAQELYDSIVAKTGLIGNRSEKIKKKGYAVLKGSEMPAFLIENGFMDSKTDVPIILSVSHAEKTARGILDFLKSEFALKEIEQETDERKVLYKVQCGAFRNKQNAENLLAKLKADGYSGIIVEV